MDASTRSRIADERAKIKEQEQASRTDEQDREQGDLIRSHRHSSISLSLSPFLSPFLSLLRAETAKMPFSLSSLSASMLLPSSHRSSSQDPAPSSSGAYSRGLSGCLALRFSPALPQPSNASTVSLTSNVLPGLRPRRRKKQSDGEWRREVPLSHPPIPSPSHSTLSHPFLCPFTALLTGTAPTPSWYRTACSANAHTRSPESQHPDRPSTPPPMLLGQLKGTGDESVELCCVADNARQTAPGSFANPPSVLYSTRTSYTES